MEFECKECGNQFTKKQCETRFTKGIRCPNCKSKDFWIISGGIKSILRGLVIGLILITIGYLGLITTVGFFALVFFGLFLGAIIGFLIGLPTAIYSFITKRKR